MSRRMRPNCRGKNVSLHINFNKSMDSKRKLILISNDDGYLAPGINLLIEWLRPLADLIVVAPESGRSGAACSITSAVPVTVEEIRSEEGLKIYACSGTPTDCVKLALHDIVPRRPDLVVGNKPRRQRINQCSLFGHARSGNRGRAPPNKGRGVFVVQPRHKSRPFGA